MPGFTPSRFLGRHRDGLPDLVPVPILNARIVLLAVGVMGAVGLGAGVIPAWRAARVDPAETLRME